MKLHQPTVVFRRSQEGKRPEYYVAIPRYMCEALNCWPSGGNANVSSPVIVWARLLDYAPSAQLRRTVPPASRFRLIVFPYEPPQDLNDLYRLQMRMVNRQFALFAVSWVLSLCAISLVSSTGIDSIDEFGILDTIARIEPRRKSAQYAGHTPHEAKLESLINAVVQWLAQNPNAAGEHSALMSAVGDMRDDLEIQFHLPDDVAQMASDQWAQEMVSRGVGVGDLIPAFPETGNPQGYVRIEKCFGTAEVGLRARNHQAAIHVGLPDGVDTQADLGYLYLQMPSRISGAGSALSRGKFTFLPVEGDGHSYATVGLDSRSGTLSVHLKPSGEAIAHVSVEMRSETEAGDLGGICQVLGDIGFDLRTLGDRSARVGTRCREWVDLAANVSGSPLVLLDRPLGEEFIRQRLRSSLRRRPLVHIAWPHDLRPSSGCIALRCSCERGTADARCPRGNAFSEECTAVRARLSGDRNTRLATRWPADPGTHTSVVALRRQGRVRTTVLERTTAWVERPLGGRRAARFSHTSPLSSIITKTLTVASSLQDMSAFVCGELFRQTTSPEPLRYAGPVIREGETATLYIWTTKGTRQRQITWGDELGRGRAGRVFGAESRQQFCGISSWAVKVPPPFLLMQELKTLVYSLPRDTAPLTRIAQLKGPGAAEKWVILMERLRGSSLDKELMEESAIPSFRQVLEALRAVASHIASWQTAGIVHWDIKPANVFRLRTGGIRLVDPGLIGSLGTDGQCQANVEWELADRIQDAFGSWYHVAPEIKKHRPTTNRTPVYSWGALACNLLGDPRALDVENQRIKPRFPEWASVLLGDRFGDLVTACLQENPAERPLPGRLSSLMAQILRRVVDA